MFLSPNIVREIKCRILRRTSLIAGMEEGKSAFNILADKYTGKVLLGRPRCRREENIRMYLKEISINTKKLG